MAEGCYVPNYFPASFKGVPFDAMDVSSEHGRRGAEGEFPFSESTAYADLGRKIRRYPVKGRFVRNDHIDQSGALIAVCESPGPGLLVHPTRGAVMVACVSLTVSDNVLEEQGVTYVDMEFVEANDISAIMVGGSLFGIGVTAIYEAINFMFVDQYRIEAVPFYRIKPVQETMSDRMNSIKREFTRYNAKNPTLSGWQAIASMQDIVDDPANLRDPQEAFTTFKRATKTLANVTTGADKYGAFKRIANEAANVSALPSTAGDAEDAINVMTRMLAMVNMVQAALEIPLANLIEALRQYDEVTQIITEELAAARATCQDGLFIRLREFETQAKTAMLKRAYDLPALVEYKFSGHVHSLVASYEIYGNAKRFREIEHHNNNRWPFLVGPVVVAPRA